MDDKKWKKDNKPSACTQPPWYVFIPVRERPEILRLIRQECIDAYGYSFDECPNRKVCIGKSCIGRPLPYKSETALKYLKELEKVNTVKDEKLYISTDCGTCPLFKTCKSPCNQVIDYINRDKSAEPDLAYNEDLEKLKPREVAVSSSTFYFNADDIPWDCISERNKSIVKEYVYNNRDFRAVAKKHGLFNQAAAKYVFYLSLNKMSEYGVMRDFLKKNSTHLTKLQYEILYDIYFNNKTKSQVGKDKNVSKQAVQQLVTRVVKKYKIKWKKFTRKERGKTLYSTIEVIK